MMNRQTSKPSRQFRARLDLDLMEDLSSDQVLNFYKVENPSQLARRLFREAVDKAKTEHEPKKVEFRV